MEQFLTLEEQDDEEISFLRLYCKNCDYVECPLACKYPTEYSGCTRKVSEDEIAKYNFLVYERLEMAKQNGAPPQIIKEYAQEALDFCYDNIYNSPYGRIIKNKYWSQKA